MNRLSVALLMTLAISIFIWIIGPKLGVESVLLRALTIAIVVQLGVGYGIYQWVKKRNNQMTPNRSEATKTQDFVEKPVLSENSKAKIYALQTSFVDNLQLILNDLSRFSKLKNLKIIRWVTQFFHNKALYTRPWYLVMGSRTSGKSTLLRNTRLHYPMLEKAMLQVKGLGGTEQCEWWFFDNAIFLDTPGRYTVESESQLEWDTLLNLLKKYRRGLPLNGVMVTLSMRDMLEQPEKAIKDMLQCRKRIHELNVKFKLNIPVHVMITHLDYIQGFQEFLPMLEKSGKDQTVGFYFNEDAHHTARVNTIQEGMIHMGERLNTLAVHRMAGMTHVHEKVSALNFGFHFKAAIQSVICTFEALSLPNSYQTTPFLSGLWFVSEKAFTKDWFSHRVAEDNIRDARSISAFRQSLKDRDRGEGTDFKIRKQKHQAKHRRWVIACAVSILVLPPGCLFYSHALNQTLVDKALVLKQGLMGVIGYDVLSNQLALYKHIVTLQDLNAHTPLIYRVARYKGQYVLSGMKQTLTDSLNKTVLEISRKEREAQLQQYAYHWLELSEGGKEEGKSSYYDTLKNYLMLFMPQHIEVEELRNTMTSDYLKHFNVNIQNSTDKESLNAMIKFYLHELKGHPHSTGISSATLMNQTLITKARQHLFSVPNVEIFNKILKRVENSGQFQNLKLTDLISRFGTQWLKAKYELSALYTVEGWESFVQPMIRRMISSVGQYDWVLDRAIEQKVQQYVEADLRAHYFAQYRKAWELFLSGIEIQPFEGLVDTHAKLEELCNLEGPLLELVRITAKHTQALTTTVPELKSWDIAGLTPVVVPGVEKPISENLDDYLRALHSVKVEIHQMLNNPNMAWVLHSYVEMILNPRKKMPEQGEQSYLSEEKTQTVETTGLQKAEGAVRRATLTGRGLEGKRAFSNLLLSIVRESWRAIVKESVVGLQEKWDVEVLDLYHQKLAGTFPFADAETEASMPDVMEFFHPEHGKLWGFVKKHLDVYLKSEEHTWKPRSWLGITPEFSPSFLASINHASRITKSIFRSEKYEPSFQFELFPEPSSALSEFSLETCGQAYRYRNEPEEWRSFEWSLLGAKQGSKIMAFEKEQEKTKKDILVKNKILELKEPSSWGLFRLLKQALILKEEGKQIFWFQWTLNPEKGEPVQVTFRFKSLKPENPFEELVMHAFQLPKEVMR